MPATSADQMEAAMRRAWILPGSMVVLPLEYQESLRALGTWYPIRA